tara:strand:+ start:304 stop:2067 length:1764 start_codon:yes stop_codon:yes gene_type:complete
MVWGNLATGYWLGGAAAAGLHWVELGRATLSSSGDNINVEGATAAYPTADWTENFSAATPTSWVENSSSGYADNLEPYKSSSNGLWFDFDENTSKMVGTLDLQNAGLLGSNADDSKWILRFKINFTVISATQSSVWIGLSSNTDASRDTQKFVGVRFKSNSTGMTTGASRYTSGSALSGSSGENDTGSTASTYSTGTDYYVTIQRTGTGTDSTRTATIQATIRTGSHTGTVLGTSTDDIYAQTGLRYFKIMNNRLSSGANGQQKGYVYDVEFYDGINRLPADLAAKPYMMVLLNHINNGGYVNPKIRFNNDGGSNYASRYSDNGGSDSTSTSQSEVDLRAGELQAPAITTTYVINKSDKEKLFISHSNMQNTAGAGNAPSRAEVVGKWTNTSDQITSVKFIKTASGNFASGSECVVLGYDPDDTEGTSVWEELASVTLGSAGNNLSSGTISAKKYLWVQAHCEKSGGATNVQMEFNNDTGNNYIGRYNANGGTDGTTPSRRGMDMEAGISSINPILFNAFIINKSDKEKLVISECISRNTSGAGNAPARAEVVFKWANTSSQITEIDLYEPTNNLGAGTTLKVWGFD